MNNIILIIIAIYLFQIAMCGMIHEYRGSRAPLHFLDWLWMQWSPSMIRHAWMGNMYLYD